MRSGMSRQFDFVSVTKKPTIHYGGRSISHVLHMQDGTRKTIGVILPSPQPLVFEVHVNERMEIVSGQCLVQIGDESEYRLYRESESFIVSQGSVFRLQAKEVVDYVCHFE